MEVCSPGAQLTPGRLEVKGGLSLSVLRVCRRFVLSASSSVLHQALRRVQAGAHKCEEEHLQLEGHQQVCSSHHPLTVFRVTVVCACMCGAVVVCHSRWKMLRFFQVDDLQEEKTRIRQVFAERGFEGGHLLLPPNNRGGRKQLGHLKTTAARSERTRWTRPSPHRQAISWQAWRSSWVQTLQRPEVLRTLVSKETRWRCVS